MSGAWESRLTRDNAFDAVRLALASMVIFEHAFFLIDNSVAREPLYILTRGQVNSGNLAVYFFLTVSGFLVARSRVTSSLADYFAKRALRIVPGFIVATVVGVVIVGGLTASPGYFAQQNWRALILTTLALKQAVPVGALAGNPLTLVHGTLWSIRYEFDCYLILGLLGSLGWLGGRKAIAAFAVIASGLAFLWLRPLPAIDHGLGYLLTSSPDNWGTLFPFFFAGAAFYLWRDRIPKSPWLLAAALAWMGLSARLGGLYWALVFAGSYAILYLAMSFKFEPRLLGRRVDLSYGLYLYGWPVEQLLIHYLDPPALSLFALAMPLSMAVAFVSWTWVEAPALRLVHRGRTRTGEPAPAHAPAAAPVVKESSTA